MQTDCIWQEMATKHLYSCKHILKKMSKNILCMYLCVHVPMCAVGTRLSTNLALFLRKKTQVEFNLRVVLILRSFQCVTFFFITAFSRVHASLT